MWDALDDDAKVAPPKPWDKKNSESSGSTAPEAPKDAPAEESVDSGNDMFAETSTASAGEDPTDLF